MEIKSVFKYQGRIPKKYTCDSENINPPLKIIKIPKNARALAVIAEDIDAPGKIFVHWVAYDIKTDGREIEIGEGEGDYVGVQGDNSIGSAGYTGPCPPSGSHRYYFKAYALDAKLDLKPGATKQEVEEKMASHILDEAELMGVYSKHS